MKCAKARDLFSSYLESEMDVPTSLHFEQHLSECPDCKAQYDRFSAAVMMLDEVPEVDPPANFHASVMERVEQLRGAAPSTVRWWQIDWQHVFTIRVPARAAALALAMFLMVVVLVQITPAGTAMMNLLGLQKASHKLITESDSQTAPSFSLRSGDAVSGLMISVTSEVDESARVYALQLQSKSKDPVPFEAKAGHEPFKGSVVRNQDSVIRVPVGSSRNLVVAEVRWTYGGRSHTQYIFLPRKFDPNAHTKRLNVEFRNMTAQAVLGKVARTYGVVILASGDLRKMVPVASVQSGNASEALFHGVEESGVNMKQELLAPSIFVVEPAK